MKLIVPVNPWDAVYFAIGILFSMGLDFIYPGNILFIYKYIVIPVLIRFILTKTKLDGKKPHKFFSGFVVYLICNRPKERFGYIEKPRLKTFKGEFIPFHVRIERAKDGDSI